nr:hypothetical protein [Tanacetum cinerariifolium]
KTQVNLQLQLQRVRTDNGTEFKNKTLAKFFDEVGITQQFSAARTPQQNGVVERRNRTLVEAARTMLTFANLPSFLWAEAIATACFTQNHLEVAFHQHTCFIRNLKGVSADRISRKQSTHPVSGDMMAQGLVKGLPKLKFKKDHLCSACAMGKSKKKSHKPKSKDTNKEKLYLLYMDLCGPMRVESVNEKKYILVIIDDYSQFTWVKCLRSKDEAPDFIIKFFKMIQVRLKVGISHETSIARSLQQNGVVERQAVGTACYTQNRSIVCLSYGKTPYELLHGKLPDLSVDPPAPAVIASIAKVIDPVLAESTGSSSSTTVDQDAPSLRVTLPTSASGSQPLGNTKKDKILQTPSSANKNKLEAYPRNVRTRNACPLTKITTTAKGKPIPLESNTPKPVVTLVYSKKPKESRNNVPVNKSKINNSLSADKKEPNKSWGSTVSNVPSFSTVEYRLSRLFYGIWNLAAPST